MVKDKNCLICYPVPSPKRWAEIIEKHDAGHVLPKKCNRCGLKERVSWHSFCKECYRELDRARYYRDREKRLARDKKYYQSHRKQWIVKKALANAKWPEKERARQALRSAVAHGKIQKKPCEVCGEKKVHGHHTDYTKPLKVNWLCTTHHYERHRKYKLGGTV